MSHVLTLPDALYERLSAYAAEHQQTAEEALAALVEGLPAGTSLPQPHNTTKHVSDPWEGFYGRFTADVPDLTINHDKYLAEAYQETHADDE